MRWILHIRVFIIIFLAVTLISAAVIFSVLRAVLPHATGYKNEIEQEISQQIGLPVKIEFIDAAIHWFSPRLKLINVSVYDKKNNNRLFHLEEAFVELDVLASIFYRDFLVDDIGLIGADISIEKLSDNEWLVQGVRFVGDASSELPEEFLYMLQNADYLLHDSNIFYRDHTDEKLSVNLLDVNIDVKNDFGNHDVRLSINLPEEYGQDIAIVAKLNGDFESLDGELYIEGHQLNIKQFDKRFSLLQQYRAAGIVDVALWITLEDSLVSTLYSQLSATDMVIHNNVTDDSWRTDFLSANTRFVRTDNHWHITIGDFYFGSKSQPKWERPINIVISEDDDNFHVNADYVSISDLQEMASALINEDLLDKFKIFQSWDLKADIYNLDLSLPKQMQQPQLSDGIKLEASVFDLAIDVNGIDIKGLDGFVQYDSNRAAIDLLSRDTRIDIKKLFREPVYVDTMQGKLVLGIEGDGWTMKSDELLLENSHITTWSRLDIKYHSADNIFTDIQTDFYNVKTKYTSRYLPVGIMSGRLVDWLDMAITNGFVQEGTFIMHGRLQDFPYTEHDGAFQVLFSPQKINMRFLREWPLLTNVAATVKFENKSLVVKDIRAKSMGANLYNGYVRIRDMKKPHLSISTYAHAKNEDIQSYIEESPLNNSLGEALRLFELQGKSDLSLKIDIPLRDINAVAVDGHVNFINSTLYYPAMDYEISDINGTLAFTRNSIYADSIKAKIQHNAASIDALVREGDAGREMVFQLDSRIPADYLLRSFQWLPEDLVTGDSPWSIEIAVPYQNDAQLAHITGSSTLENVAINMSDRIHKNKGEKLNFSTVIDVLDNNGLHFDVQADSDKKNNEADSSIIRLYAVRDDKNIWSLDLDSRYVAGKAEFNEGLSKQKQVKLDLEKIDVYALFANHKINEAPRLNPEDFPPLHWKAKKLIWDNWTFTDASLETGWHEHGMVINKCSLKGPSLIFNARGSWLKSWHDKDETVLQGTLKGDNLGEALTGLGFQKSIDQSSYSASFNAKWMAQPYAVSWENINGTSDFALTKGQMLDLEPGAGGRLLGLLNIFKLANRLVLDFTDVTRKGFTFDSINGEFEFVNGAGSLKKFDVSAPAADITMFGSIGLLDRDYGLLMRVKPHTDTLTFASGALLGGVTVGAGLALIQKVFDLDVIGQNIYSITGSWEDPVIEKIVERKRETNSDIVDNDF